MTSEAPAGGTSAPSPGSTRQPTPRPPEWDSFPRPEGQLDDRLGIDIVDWTPDHVVATMPVAGNLQPYGLLHGGASAAIAETVGSTAAALNSGGSVCVGTQVLANHHRAARSGTVTAVATPIHLGRSLKTFRIEITDDDDQVVCTAQLTAMTLPRPPGAS